ncbi:MAG: ATP-grasp domain-containing protein, partial [Sphingobacteriales bacterium]|nr:ATP-grasp domain-containing protein [Sphingobacteriales bacterium]
KVTVAVTGLNNIDSPGPGIPVIRGLLDSKDYDIRIIGLSYDALEPGIYMHELVDKTYQIPLPSAGQSSIMERLRYINSVENIDVIIPNFDAELYNFITIAPQLKALGIHTFLPSYEMFDARDKLNLYAFGQKHGLLVPKDRVIYQAADLQQLGDEFGYPLVVKGKYYEAVVAYTLEQAQKAFYKISAKWGLPIIVQQFINGTEVNIAALGDGEGNATSIIPMRKMYITDKGKAWAGITLDDEALIELARKFITVTKWRGGFEVEIMKTVNDELYIMEINPRFPAWIYLTAGAGQNQPAALVKMAMGETVAPYTDFDAGKLFIRYSWDLVVDVSRFQQFSAFGNLSNT